MCFKADKGLGSKIVEEISSYKGEPEWMRDFRLRRSNHSRSTRCRTGAATCRPHRLPDIHYYVRATEKQGSTWDDVPEDIKNTFERLGIPEAERKFLAGVGAQYESEVVYHSLREESRSWA